MKSRKIALAALVVGSLDIAEVILFYWMRGVAPIRVLQGVPAGLLAWAFPARSAGSHLERAPTRANGFA